MHRRNIAAFAVLALAVLSCAPGTDRRSSDDEARLLLLHEEAMRAHLESNVDLLLQGEEDDYIVSSRGEVSHPDREARRQFLGPYLKSTSFSVYRDLIPPVVKVSKDGSLGWVIVQVEAKGEQTEPDGAVAPLEFVSSWISLYEKRNGRWVGIGNVSNFKPGPGV
jgi:hypothetical protein